MHAETVAFKGNITCDAQYTHLRPHCTPLIQPAVDQNLSSCQWLSSLLENRSVIAQIKHTRTCGFVSMHVKTVVSPFSGRMNTFAYNTVCFFVWKGEEVLGIWHALIFSQVKSPCAVQGLMG